MVDKYNFLTCTKCEKGGGTLVKQDDGKYIHQDCQEVNQNNRRERRKLYKQLMKKK